MITGHEHSDPEGAAVSKDIAGRWIRVSTGAQDEANQEPDIDRWISQHGYRPGPDYRLRGKSASKGKHQAELDQVVEDMKAGKLNVLVVWHYDRIERRGAWNAFDLARRVREAGGRIEYVLTPHLNQIHDFSDTFLAMESDRAKAESKRTSERVRAAHSRIKSNGGIHGRAGYGYRFVGERYAKTLEIHEPEALIIHEAVRRYLGGETVDAIRDDFNRRGMGGKHWHSEVLAKLLRNPSIAGRRVNAEGQTVATFEPIISWDEHLRLVKRLNDRAHRKGISPGVTALLTSLLFDADGNPMYAINRGGPYAKYYSRKSKVGVDLAEMDERVNELFVHNTAPFLIPQVVPGENNGDEIARLRRDRAELDDLAPDYDERHAGLTERIRELAREDAENPRPDRVELVDSGKTVGQVWREMTTAQRHDLLRDRNARVTWRGDGWSFEGDGFGLGDGALNWDQRASGSTLRERALRAHADAKADAPGS
jgi:DNA invertase Pin-like site-specific DNA recombinase